jgi:hypothetical protein
LILEFTPCEVLARPVGAPTPGAIRGQQAAPAGRFMQ